MILGLEYDTTLNEKDSVYSVDMNSMVRLGDEYYWQNDDVLTMVFPSDG